MTERTIQAGGQVKIGITVTTSKAASVTEIDQWLRGKLGEAFGPPDPLPEGTIEINGIEYR